MRGGFAQFSVATAERHSQLVLQFLEVREFASQVDELGLQPTPHGRARLQVISPKA
jgi:hypothetical protein